MGFSDIVGVMNLHRFWVFLLFSSGLWVVCLCNQDAGTGYLSLSCGGTTSYTDSSNISWVSDDSYITTGINSTVHHIEGTSSSTVPIRAFPNPLGRKCYKLPTKNLSSVILVRAQFLYKNYDRLQKPPTFSVSLGTSITSTVNLTAKDPWTEEFVWPVNKDTLLFCLHTIHDGGSPVISSLEVRPLPVRGYRSRIVNLSNKVLRKRYRINCGDTNGTLRYPFDPYDRIWDKDSNFTPLHLSSVFDSQLDFSFSSVAENPPVSVLQSARVLARKNVLTYDFPFDTIGDFYIVLYFAGILHAPASFGVIVNGAVMESSYSVNVSETSALYYTRKSIKSLNITLTSIKSHPQINAIEVYEIVDVPPEVSSTTVSALEVIQQSAGLDLGWQDDPCSPTTWDHIHCEGNTVTSLELPDINLRSISPTFGDLLDLKNLDLHNTSLSGQIQDLGSLQHLTKLNLSFNQLTSFGPSLENLVSLQILDLQNNSLLGTVPDSLGKLKDLHLLNLENNKLQGSLPDSLNRESLELRTSGNLLCLSFSTTTCNDVHHNSSIEAPQVTIVTQKKQTGHSHIPIIIGSIVGALLVVLLFIGILVFLLTRKNISEVTYTSRSVELDMRNWNAAKVFSYREIKSATNQFKVVLGRGSFGSVYLGKLSEGKLVAVKVRFDRSQLGAESFINEVNLLSRIRHQNLVCLEGFCNESKQQILVYEYLPGGSLADHIYGPSSKKKSLSWVRRLKIAVDAAKGLDYLHNGSDPRIIHRDVKCGNILLDTEMNAKVCDFGLSKQVTQPDASHVTTVVKGTAGYLDPEYYSTQQLTEKSDIYSFGVVLLELICGREPLRHHGSPDSFNLVLWAKPYLQAGAYEIVVDESIMGSFDVESLRKTASVAVRSVERDAAQRPTIRQVLAELKEAYTLQLSFLASSANGNVS